MRKHYVHVGSLKHTLDRLHEGRVEGSWRRAQFLYTLEVSRVVRVCVSNDQQPRLWHISCNASPNNVEVTYAFVMSEPSNENDQLGIERDS